MKRPAIREELNRPRGVEGGDFCNWATRGLLHHVDFAHFFLRENASAPGARPGAAIVTGEQPGHQAVRCL